MKNRIRETREKLGWTQQQLAAAVGTSQQQIARIETGNQSVKLDTALAIAAVLRSDIGELFPATRKLIGQGENKKDRNALVDLHYNPAAVEEFESAGVDLDPATWLLQLRLRGGAQPEFACSTAESQRVRRSVSTRDSSTPFVVFRSSVVEVALNVNHLTHYHELWDGNIPPDWHDETVPRDEVAVFFADSAAPSIFDVEVDDGQPDDPNDLGQMRAFLLTLETLVDPGEFLSFRDADGEDAFFRMEDVALLTVPLRVLDPRLNDMLVEAEEGLPGEGGEEADDSTQDSAASPSNSRNHDV